MEATFEEKREGNPTVLARRLKCICRWLLRSAGLCASLLVVYLGILYLTLPDVNHLVEENPSSTSYIRNWAEQEGLAPDDYRIKSWTSFEDIAPVLIRATIYAEDTNFYEHNGVEWDSTRKMAWRYINGLNATGVSTIPQQLARNLFLEGKFSVQRKIQEIMLALRLVRTLSRERIMELYLNVIEWREGVWGITQATQHYFGKNPDQLDPFECIFLPSVLPAPRRELTGRNLFRATGSWRRNCYYLYLKEEMTLDEWVFAKRGLSALEIALKKGEPLERALELARLSLLRPAFQ